MTVDFGHQIPIFAWAVQFRNVIQHLRPYEPSLLYADQQKRFEDLKFQI